MASIIDNKNKTMLDSLKNSLKQAESVDILTAFFYFSGFNALAEELKDTTVFDPTRCPYYDADQWDFGIFRWDLIHYQGRVNDWVASEILEEYKKR